MDPVSRILAERQRARPRLLPYAMIAVALHGAVAAVIFLASRTAAARPAQLPAVSVRIVRPESQPRRRAERTAPQPTRPPARETPPPEPEPVATEPPQTAVTQPPSDTAMAAPDRRATPRPTPAPAAAGGGRGLSLGAGDDREISGIPSDFHFAYYVQRMLALIESRWYKPAVPAGTSARVRFTIGRDGSVSRIELETSSGLPSFDRAALRALYAANPLPPLPPAYVKPSLTVHLTFSE